jgi:phosphatidylserine/phosphatidylglycerophosphate/cardiolipin synthase-like enzyme
MHLKRYQIDGRLLRTGAANFSASGLKRQDNDLIVIESAAAATFKRAFDGRFANGEVDPGDHSKRARALEILAGRPRSIPSIPATRKHWVPS